MEKVDILSIWSIDWKSCRISTLSLSHNLFDREDIELKDNYMLINTDTPSYLCIPYRHIMAIELFNQSKQEVHDEIMAKLHPFKL